MQIINYLNSKQNTINYLFQPCISTDRPNNIQYIYFPILADSDINEMMKADN